MNCYNENFVNNFDSAFVIVCTIVLWWHIDLSPVKITLLRMALGGPAQVQSHEKKSRLSIPQKNRQSDLQFFFWHAHLACLAGWRCFSFFLRFAPLAKNRAAQRTLVKATPHSGLQFKQIILVSTFFTPLGTC